MVSTSNRPFTPMEGKEAAWMSDLEERVDTLETAERLVSASIRGGAVVVYTDDLTEVGRLGVGEYKSNGSTRNVPVLSITNPESKSHVLIDFESGWVAPKWQYNWQQDISMPVTSASYVSTWKTSINMLGFAIMTRVYITSGATTTGTVRLSLGGNFTDEVPIAADAAQWISFAWDLTDQVEFNSYNTLRVEAKRDTGATNINIFAPDATFAMSTDGATHAVPGGLPVE